MGDPLGNAIFGDLELTFKVDLDFISDLDFTHSMVLIPINGIILGELFRKWALLTFKY